MAICVVYFCKCVYIPKLVSGIGNAQLGPCCSSGLLTINCPSQQLIESDPTIYHTWPRLIMFTYHHKINSDVIGTYGICHFQPRSWILNRI